MVISVCTQNQKNGNLSPKISSSVTWFLIYFFIFLLSMWLLRLAMKESTHTWWNWLSHDRIYLLLQYGIDSWDGINTREMESTLVKWNRHLWDGIDTREMGSTLVRWNRHSWDGIDTREMESTLVRWTYGTPFQIIILYIQGRHATL